VAVSVGLSFEMVEVRRSLEPGLDVLQRINAPLFAYLPV
jgi:hypothetical protein